MLPLAMTALGLATHLPYLDAARAGLPYPGPSRLYLLHAGAMLMFTTAAQWEIVNGWRDAGQRSASASTRPWLW